MKFLFVFFAFAACFMASCQKKPQTTFENTHARPKVAISMPPYKTFVEAIAKEHVEVICLVPQGTNPHLYETPPQLIEQACQAKLWLRLGEPGEKKISEFFFKHSPGMHIVDLSVDLPLLDQGPCCHHDENAIDRHIWLSPKLAHIQATKICDALCLLCPEKTSLFQENLFFFQNQLTKLDAELKELFEKSQTHAVLISHPSLGYFCRDYQLEQLSVEIEGKEPLPRDIDRLFTTIRAHEIDRILIQPQHSVKGALRIAEELHLLVKTIDPYAEDYLNTLRSIAYAIRE